jgi:hypothetical protein
MLKESQRTVITMAVEMHDYASLQGVLPFALQIVKQKKGYDLLRADLLGLGYCH